VASAGDDNELTARAVPTRLLVVLTTVGLVLGALGWGFALTTGPRDEYRTERRAAITRADEFAVAFNTYKLSDKADYQRRLKTLMTPKFYGEFSKVTNAMFTALKDREQQSGDVKVLSIAVDTIDKDSASVIVAVNSSVKVASEKAAVLRRFRWQVSLTKADGSDEWLVNRFDTVPPMEATIGDVTGKTKESAK